MSERFGAYVRRLRNGETRKAVASRAGISAEYLRQIENLGQVPKEDKLIALARALGQDPKELLARGLREKNLEAAKTMLAVKPKFARTRQILASRLSGPELELIKEDMAGLAQAPQERVAVLLWAGAFFIDSQGLNPAAALELAREKSNETDFVENVLADYVARHLVSWQVDPENGRQTHRAGSPRVDESLDRMAEHLGQVSGKPEGEALDAARKFAELLKEPEFAALYHHLQVYRELSEHDKGEIRAWWEVVNRMVDERLAQNKNKKGS